MRKPKEVRVPAKVPAWWARATKPRGPLPGWKSLQHLCMGIARKDRMLAVFVTQNETGYGVAAVSSPIGRAVIAKSTSMQVAAKVYDDHAHEIVGVYKSLRRALKAADGFALEWLKRGPRADKCACGPIRKAS